MSREWLATCFANYVLTLADLSPGKTQILDYACGPGLLCEKLAPHCKRIVGVDSNAHLVELFNKKVAEHGISSEEMHASETLDEGCIFDIVTCTMAYHHMQDLAATTSMLMAHVAPGGILVVIDLDAHCAYAQQTKKHSTVCHQGGISEDQLALAFDNAGAQDYYVDSFRNVKDDKVTRIDKSSGCEISWIVGVVSL